MDRRVIWAVALMMLVALLPTFFFKRPAVDAGRESRVAGPVAGASVRRAGD
jgi:hypothetical protein